ncbi:MAG TPA: hypothetical protein EYG99_01940 [Candidatus Pacebacteria bacterium]|nr:hypothetical protein [Candidatus Paceibacterota bacterium]
MNTIRNDNVEFFTVFNTVLAGVPSRSREIIAKRFGIGEEAPLTLQAIGDEYDITRERVRQIVQSGLRSVYNAGDNNNSEFVDARDIIVRHIEDNEGIITVDKIVLLGGDSRDEHGAIRFLIEGMNEVKAVSYKEYPVKSDVVALVDFDIKNWNQVHNTIKDILQIKEKTYTSERLYEKLENDVVKCKQLEKYLEVSAEIEQNPFKKWGLKEWDEISPRGVREKALLIMKESGEPMHFRKVAEMIDLHGLGKKGKKSHPQTVHNELIRDDNFVLVGRGVYTLNADNHIEGTVKDVIENILKKSNEPLTAEEVIERVLKMRHVQPTTVKANLNAVAKKLNKKYTLDTNAS